MNDSILNTIKKMLGLDENNQAFDTELIVFVNSALMVLHQLGATPKAGFVITGPTETWTELLPTDKLLEGAKAYVYLKTRIAFDPPASSYVLSAYERQIEEWEGRIKMQLEAYPGDIEDDPEEDPRDSRHDYYDPWAEGDL